MSTITAELPDSVVNSMKHLAKVEGMPIERLAALAIAQAVGAWSIQQQEFTERAARGNRSGFEAAMNQVPNNAPLPGDE